MPETPRWLVQKGRVDEARRVLARLGSRDGTLEEIQAAVRREADQQGAGWGAVFKPKTRGVRRAILVGVGVGAAQQMLAEEALLFYLPRILLDLGETRNRVYAALVGMGVLKTLCIVVAAVYLDKSGRRPMLLGSVFGMGLSLLVIGTAFSAGLPVLAVVATWAYMMSFSLGIGPGCWLVASEVFPLVIRAKCMALATVANRVFSSLIASTFLSWAGAMTYAGYFYFFTALSVLLWATLYVYLPETSGKSLEAMSDYFASLFGEEVATPPAAAKGPVVANPMVCCVCVVRV